MRSTITATLLLLSCAAVPQATIAQPTPVTPASPTAYLAPAELPDPRSYLPGPPAAGSPALAADRAAYQAAVVGKDGPAWKQASEQLRVRSPAVQKQIMCAIGV